MYILALIRQLLEAGGRERWELALLLTPLKSHAAGAPLMELPGVSPNGVVVEAYWTSDGPVYALDMHTPRTVDIAPLWREFDLAELDERLQDMTWLHQRHAIVSVRWDSQDHGSAAARKGRELERRRRAKHARQGRRGRYYLSMPEIRVRRERSFDDGSDGLT